MFITLEGTEGSGKTTQIKHIVNCFNRWDINYIVTREPGGTVLGNQIRSVLLDVNNSSIDPVVELLLCLADRVQHIKDVIQPGIDDNMVVLCDRYVDSTLVYQGFARGIDISTIWNFHEILCSGLMPDITFLIDLDPSLSLSRARNRDFTIKKKNNLRFEQEEIKFHRKIRKGYLKLARLEPERFFLVDGCLDENKVKWEIERIIKKQLLKEGFSFK